MRRKTLERLLVAAALLAAPAAGAQPMMKPGGGGKMPPLSEMVGRPLPNAGMPTGTVSVRVARKMPANAAVNVEVSAIIKNAGGDMRKRALKTDESGRVLFEGLVPGDQFTAEVTVDGERLKSQTFTMPETGGLQTMLISGITGGGAAQGASGPGGAASGEREPRAFALGATAGQAEPDDALPAGTLEVRLFDEKQSPIADHNVVLGMVNEDKQIETRYAKSDAAGQARFTGLPIGEKTGYAAVIDWHGLRLNTAPFGMPEGRGMRAEIRALARTADPSVITIGEGGRVVVQMREDSLQILEFLPLENTSDKMYDPGPGAFEIQLPSGFTGAQPQENERKVEVRQNHGIAVHGPIVPKRSLLGVSESERKANEVVFGFVLPYDGDTHVFSQPMPNGIGLTTLIVDKKIPGLTASGPGVGAGQERSLGGNKYWVMPIEAVAPGGTLTFTLNGLPSTDSWGRRFAAGVSVLFVIAAIAFARRPRAAGAAKQKSGTDEKSRLVAKREALFAELVALERAARAAGTPAPADQRKQLVARLEQVYQDLAALDERRAA